MNNSFPYFHKSSGRVIRNLRYTIKINALCVNSYCIFISSDISKCGLVLLIHGKICLVSRDGKTKVNVCSQAPSLHHQLGNRLQKPNNFATHYWSIDTCKKMNFQFCFLKTFFNVEGFCNFE